MDGGIQQGYERIGDAKINTHFKRSQQKITQTDTRYFVQRTVHHRSLYIIPWNEVTLFF